MSFADANWIGRRVFVTGATGLLGSHLVRMLCERQAEVIVLAREQVPSSLFYSSCPEWNLVSKVTVVKGSIEDEGIFGRILDEHEPDTVIHLAGQAIVQTANLSPIPTFKLNIEGTWNLLEAIRLHPKEVSRVIIASSARAYARSEGGAHDESFPLRGDHPYDVSKSCADLIARSYAIAYKLPICITRCANFFGPGDLNYSRIIPGTIRSVLQGKSPVIRSNGKSVRDFLYVEDAASAYLTLAEEMERNDFRGEAFNFSYGSKLTALEIVEQVLEIMSRGDLKATVLNQAVNEVPVESLNSTKAREILGWRPRFGFLEGLHKTVKWYSQILAEDINFRFVDSPLKNIEASK